MGPAALNDCAYGQCVPLLWRNELRDLECCAAQSARMGSKPLSSLFGHSYPLTTVLWGIARPLRQLQAHVGSGDEVILLARKGENG
jgi:hypothetical protein